jgi:hypothetical protein
MGGLSDVEVILAIIIFVFPIRVYHVLTARRASAVVLLLLLAAGGASAQALPEGPIQAFDGRMTVSGEVIAVAGSHDDVAFFNYTDYEHNALRMTRFALSGLYRPATWLAFVGELRSEDLEHPSAYAAYARVRPWKTRPLDIQAGLIPPAFGAFGRRIYGTGNPVIGYPLAYQYLTSLRTDAAPSSADDVLRMRARGWRSSFPIGSAEPGPGIPLVSAFQWDTGMQVTWKTQLLDVAASITNGTLSNPRVGDDNGGKQISGRVAVTPAVGLIIGASAARGAWLSRAVAPDSKPLQRAFGADAEYSRDHWIVRGELVWTRWEMPVVLAPAMARALDASGSWLEGRYRVTPRIFVAARADRLGFSKLSGTILRLPWDAPVQRLEWGMGYYAQRNLVLRATVQQNWRDGGRVRRRTYLSGQLAYWF